MGSCRRALLLLLLSIMFLRSEESHSTLGSTEFDDEESDSVAYMVVIEHEKGRRCAGALVSLQTALSSARCVRLSSERASLWVLAAAMVAGHGTVRAADGARRVIRLAFSGTDPADPTNDLALLAIDEPFGETAQTRPILMATAASECDAAPDCNTVRALTRRNALGSPALQLRVINVQRVPHAVCSAHVPHWAAFKERSFCLKGETLCENDVGGGVVCASLLCGVISVVGARRAEEAGCGDTFGALSVARWRRFLHCAHTQRLCGRGDCASLCTEQWLDGSDGPFPAASLSSAFQTPAEDLVGALTPPMLSSLLYNTLEENATGSTVSVHNTPSANSASGGNITTSRVLSRAGVETSVRFRLASRTPFLYELRPSADFEPNRADFKKSHVSVSTVALSLMRLKAGEYGDNALEYGAPPDEALPSSLLMSTPRRPATVQPTNPTSAPSQRIWVDPLVQPQTDTHHYKLKKSNALSLNNVKMEFLITTTTILNIYR